MRRPLGCLTATGWIAAAITAVVVVGAAAATGNGIFSPGALNARVGMMAIGGVSSHADLARRCASCHAPVWSGASMGDRCLDCHTDVRAEMGQQASLHFGLAEPGDCRNCHSEHHGPQASLIRADMHGFPHDRTGFSLRAHAILGEGGSFLCADCHGSEVRTFDVAACRDCHQVTDSTFLVDHAATFGLECLACHDGLDSYGRSFDHQNVAFPLQGKHAGLSCGRCHVGAATVQALRQTPAACIDCHRQQDIHQARLGRACEECHNPASWQGATFDHGRSGFALTGSHLLVDCQGCHVDRLWHGIATQCVDCHLKDDPHGNQFRQGCGDCHETTRWDKIAFDHSRARFALEGAHRQASCADCHANGRYVGIPSDCVACHRAEDKHGGELGLDCAACHRATSWGDVTFDHGKSRFPLTGAHQQVACAACHTSGHYRGLPTNCAGCHQKDDRHGGQFGTDCASCHRPTRWGDVTFDHNKSRFPLTGAHRGAACSQCHAGGQFKGTPTACVSCHAEPAVHAGKFGTSCGDCHTTSAWLPAGYNGPHPFPMNHGGANGTCSTCHPSALTSYTCYNCHDQSEMLKKHQEKGISDPSNCVDCHPSGKGGD